MMYSTEIPKGWWYGMGKRGDFRYTFHHDGSNLL